MGFGPDTPCGRLHGLEPFFPCGKVMEDDSSSSVEFRHGM
jgi:hypothetical protein